jgi:hypothetical protein
MNETTNTQTRSREDLIAAVTSIRSLYTRYARLDRIMKVISRLVIRPAASSEGAVFALVGETRAGKSQLLRMLQLEYPRIPNGVTKPNGDFAHHIPFAIVKLPSANLKAITARVFHALVGKQAAKVLGPRYTQQDAQTEITRVANECCLKLLVLDEAHQSIDRKTDKVAGDVAVFIKELANSAKYSILVVGTENASKLLDAEDELESRIHKVLRLRAFERRQTDLDVWFKILRDVDAHLEKRVFGRLSKLDSPDMAEALMTAANGLIGNMATLVENAGHEAVDEMLETGHPTCVRWDHLELAFTEWKLGQRRVNPFSMKNWPPPLGNDVMPDKVEGEDENLEVDDIDTVMSGVKGRVRRNHADTKLRK